MNWRVRELDPGRVGELAATTGLRPEAASVLVARGVTAERAAAFLRPRLRDLRPPDGMAGLREAAERLARAVRATERVGIFGDYDVDGVTSSALLADFLRGCGLHPVVRVARRQDGYGFLPGPAAALLDAGVTLVVTGDCGTSDHETIALARRRGADVIVVDHHQVPDGESPALALCNPHRADSTFPFRGLCSAGIAFYLAAATRTLLGSTAPDPRSLLDLAALGTIADVVPLLEENRVLVAQGLARMRSAPRPGLAALMERADLLGTALTPRDVAFRLAPRLNAPGRLGEARAALELLLAETPEAARSLADECDAANRERQGLQESALRQALAQTEGDAGEFVVVAGDWHPGVVGIVAARLVEPCARPVAVVAVQDGLGRASARAPRGVNLHALIKQAGPLLVRFGGHAAACGFTVEVARLAEVRSVLCDAARRAPAADVDLVLDAELPLDGIDLALAEEIGRMEPFGEGNPPPAFYAHDVLVTGARTVGDGHLRLRLGDAARSLSAIGFGMAGRAPAEGSRMDVAFRLQIDEYRGVRRPDLALIDLRTTSG
jgi:single-stranded-DNA-specific exonuclease